MSSITFCIVQTQHKDQQTVVSKTLERDRVCTMNTAMTKAGRHLAEWFKAFRAKNRPPYRYYEHSLYDA